MVDSPAEDRIDVDEHLDLRDGVVLLGGEARFRHLYCSRRGRRRRRRPPGGRSWAAAADVLTRDEAVARGWFGAVEPCGAAPASATSWSPATGRTAIFASADFAYETRLVGLHGSLTPDEMLIPLLVC